LQPQKYIFLYKFNHQFTKQRYDKLVKSPKFRHACEGRHPETFENTGRFKTSYETIRYEFQNDIRKCSSFLRRYAQSQV